MASGKKTRGSYPNLTCRVDLQSLSSYSMCAYRQITDNPLCSHATALGRRREFRTRVTIYRQAILLFAHAWLPEKSRPVPLYSCDVIDPVLRPDHTN
jgi:hypothetical protein